MIDTIVRTAIVGTSQDPTQTQPTTGTALDAISTQLPTDQRERSILLTAGAFTIYQQAGQSTGTREDRPAPALAETQTGSNKQQENLLATLLLKNQQLLIAEGLARLQAKQLRAPYRLLPQLLQYGSEHKSVRAAILAVIGERGYWLAQQNPAWHWATKRLVDSSESDETIWQEGILEQRVQILQERRAVDPDGARTWVEEVWNKEQAEVRLHLLATFTTGLSMADAPFLTQALQDRSAKVRTSAADLLLTLPETPQAQRLRQRADELLTYDPERGTNGEIMVASLAQLSAEWKKDVDIANSMNQKSTHHDWVKKALSFVPPEHWEERFGVHAETLLTALENDPWEESLTQAWIQAALLYRRNSWYRALLKKPLEQYTRKRRGFSREIEQLIAQLSQEIREEIATSLSTQDAETFDCFMTLVPGPWSLSLSRTFLAVVQSGIADRRPISSYWYYLAQQSATALHTEAIDFALQPDMYPAIDYESNTKKSIEFLRLRKRIQEEI